MSGHPRERAGLAGSHCRKRCRVERSTRVAVAHGSNMNVVMGVIRQGQIDKPSLDTPILS